MMTKPKHATTNFRMLLPFLDAADKAGGHVHFTSDGYMDFVVENLQTTDSQGCQWYAIAHYGKCNGDLMSDPDMEIGVNRENGYIIPRTYQNDYLGIFQSVFKTIGGRLMYSQRLLTDLDGFLWQWLKNIINQGFKAT